MISRSVIRKWLTKIGKSNGTVPSIGNILIHSGNNTNELFWTDGFAERVRIFHSINQSIPTGTATALTFDSERFDPSGMHNSTQATRITIGLPGRYIVGANVQWAADPNGSRTLDIRQNGNTILSRDQFAVFVLDADIISHIVTMAEFSVGDYIEAVVTQNSVGAVNVLASGNFSPEFWAHRLS